MISIYLPHTKSKHANRSRKNLPAESRVATLIYKQTTALKVKKAGDGVVS